MWRGRDVFGGVHMHYLTHEGAADPTVDCRDGVQNLQSITPTTADRQVAACLCGKGAANLFPDVKD